MRVKNDEFGSVATGYIKEAGVVAGFDGADHGNYRAVGVDNYTNVGFLALPTRRLRVCSKNRVLAAKGGKVR